MVAVPAATPVTRPVEALMVATAGVLLDQLPPDIVEVKMVVSDKQIVWVPLRDPAVGVSVTVRLPVAVPVPPVHPDSVTV